MVLISPLSRGIKSPIGSFWQVQQQDSLQPSIHIVTLLGNLPVNYA
jgi:hypothetical protein